MASVVTASNKLASLAVEPRRDSSLPSIGSRQVSRSESTANALAQLTTSAPTLAREATRQQRETTTGESEQGYMQISGKRPGLCDVARLTLIVG